MAFWGVAVKPGKATPFVPSMDQPAKLHLSQACLAVDAGKNAKAALAVKVGDGEALLVCSLREGGVESANLDLIIDSYAEFSVVGGAAIHLTGYYMPEYEIEGPSDEDDEEGDPYGQIIGLDDAGNPIMADDYDSEEDSDYESESDDDVDAMMLGADAFEDDEEGSEEDDSEDDEDVPRPREVVIEDITESEQQEKAKQQQQKANGKAAAFADDDVDASDDEEEDSEEEDEEEEEPPAAVKAKAGEKRKAEAAAAKQPAAKAAKQQEAAAGAAKAAQQEKEASQQAAQKQAEKEAKAAAKAEKEKAKRREFPNGFVIEELKQGPAGGKLAKGGRKVVVKYVGKLKSGKIFDQTLGNKTFAFRLGVGEVIKGWDRGVEGMRVGDKRRLTVPPQMGYGSSGIKGAIPPNAVLIFDVELVDVK